jgi:hypothetical protein
VVSLPLFCNSERRILKEARPMPAQPWELILCPFRNIDSSTLKTFLVVVTCRTTAIEVYVCEYGGWYGYG